MPVDSKYASPQPESMTVSTMVLLSSLNFAVDVVRGYSARRSGTDPSQNEPVSVVCPALIGDIQVLDEYLIHLRINVALLAEERDTVETARLFDILLTRSRLCRHLHLIHQRLMSVFPLVSAETVEIARAAEDLTGLQIQGAHQDIAARLIEVLAYLQVFSERLRNQVCKII